MVRTPRAIQDRMRANLSERGPITNRRVAHGGRGMSARLLVLVGLALPAADLVSIVVAADRFGAWATLAALALGAALGALLLRRAGRAAMRALRVGGALDFGRLEGVAALVPIGLLLAFPGFVSDAAALAAAGAALLRARRPTSPTAVVELRAAEFRRVDRDPG
jgi:hypothetical protein